MLFVGPKKRTEEAEQSKRSERVLSRGRERREET
jgi:hypothetical protein